MKEELLRIYFQLLNSDFSPNSLNYYAKLQSLAGALYDNKRDNSIYKQLQNLSNYIQFLNKLSYLDEYIKNVANSKMDFHGFFPIPALDTDTEKLTINFPKIVRFPDIKQDLPESVINNYIRLIKYSPEFKFNTIEILGWIKSRIEEM